MATLMTSPDESRLAIVDLSGEEFAIVVRALEAALEDAAFFDESVTRHALLRLLNDLDR